MEYKTEQKKLLIDFLKNHSEEGFTIEEIAGMLKEVPNAPGLSTVYRLIPKLVEEGLVKRFAGNKKRQFLYQVICDDPNHRHLHMRCTGCGKIFHMNDSFSEELMREILSVSNFSVDREKTVLLGKCDGCTE